MCGWALARAHAKAGDAAMIAGYLGSSDQFDDALAKYSEAYADQAERDYETFQAAIRSGRLSTEPAEGARSGVPAVTGYAEWQLTESDSLIENASFLQARVCWLPSWRVRCSCLALRTSPTAGLCDHSTAFQCDHFDLFLL